MRHCVIALLALTFAACAAKPQPARTTNETGPKTGAKDGLSIGNSNTAPDTTTNTATDPTNDTSGGGPGHAPPPKEKGEKGGGAPPKPPKPEMARWDKSSSCTETCNRLTDCNLWSGTKKDCGKACDDADEDEVTMATYACFAEAHDCNDMAGCNAP